VGVNDFKNEEEDQIEILKIGEEVRNHQVSCLNSIRAERSSRGVDQALNDLKTAAQSEKNLMPLIMKAVREYATLGEICSCLKEVFGVYEEPGF